MDIIENYLDSGSFKNLDIELKSNNFPWYWVEKIKGENNINNYHLSHNFYRDNRICSQWFSLIEKSFLFLIKPKALIRIKANLNIKTEKQFLFENHKDQDFDCKVALFYLNSNDGYTLINGKKINSIKNRMVFFNNDWHSSSTTTNQPNRIVINFNYF